MCTNLENLLIYVQEEELEVVTDSGVDFGNGQALQSLDYLRGGVECVATQGEFTTVKPRSEVSHNQLQQLYTHGVE